VSRSASFDELLRQTAVHIYVKDVEGRYTIASKALVESIGDAVGKTDFDLVPRWIAERWRANDQKVLDTRTPLEVEEPGVERTFLSVKVPLLDGDGRPYGVFGCSSDITTYKRMTEQLFSTQRLESLGQLASGVAHDFNNLLSVIGTFTAYLLEADLGDRARSDLDTIERAVERGAELTRQLLLFSGRRSAQVPGPVSIAAALENIERLLARTLSRQIDFEVRRGTPSLSVSAGAGHIEQIVTNLALNARDAMPEGGKLLISADAASTEELEGAGGGLDNSRGHVRLLIRDTGVGMGPAEAARAMEPFFTTKQAGEGTGLGLATVYGIAKQLGGAVTIDSAEGTGTSVYVWLPEAVDASESRAALPRPPESIRETPVVLLVEDEDDVREGTARTLSLGGYAAIPVSSGEECLRVLEASDAEVDIALLDVVLPDISGLELADRITELAPHVAIVHMSGSASSSWPQPLIEKPFSPDRLLRELDHAVRRGRGSAA
jgi:signal transduction histidine kinase/CheY-like chemotaxis protein